MSEKESQNSKIILKGSDLKLTDRGIIYSPQQHTAESATRNLVGSKVFPSLKVAMEAVEKVVKRY